jgi:hypothetical protein
MYSTGCFTKDLKEPVEEPEKERHHRCGDGSRGCIPAEADIKATLINPGHCKNSGRLKTNVAGYIERNGS